MTSVTITPGDPIVERVFNFVKMSPDCHSQNVHEGTGLTKNQVASALHQLWQLNKIVRDKLPWEKRPEGGKGLHFTYRVKHRYANKHKFVHRGPRKPKAKVVAVPASDDILVTVRTSGGDFTFTLPQLHELRDKLNSIKL